MRAPNLGKQKSKRQRVAEAEVENFRKDLGPFVAAAEGTRMAIVFTDPKAAHNPITFANDSFLALMGYGREEVLSQSFTFLMARGADPKALPQIEAAFASLSGSELEVRYQRKDGSTFWAGVFISPVRDETGLVTQHFASFVDLTKHMLEEDRLRFLLDELNHRTQNTLATVQAIAIQTLRGAADPDVLEAFQGRILALSKAHSLLGRENWDSAGLHEVIAAILQPYGMSDRRGDQFAIDGADVRLKPKAALAIALVIHELATNAAKHGALSGNAAGLIAIAWHIEPTPQGDRMQLTWHESGGPSVVPPVHKGFGSRLIESGLAQELNGQASIDYHESGVKCNISMPYPSG